MINLFDRAVAHFKEQLQTLAAENGQLRAESATLREQLAEANAHRTESSAIELWRQRNTALQEDIEHERSDYRKL